MIGQLETLNRIWHGNAVRLVRGEPMMFFGIRSPWQYKWKLSLSGKQNPYCGRESH
ncbi:MAG: hypothetical protein OXC91_00840 [Rhodobacteraceae bacterium]|nr:hypothetical protein [Paracoccaceae bacterium]